MQPTGIDSLTTKYNTNETTIPSSHCVTLHDSLLCGRIEGNREEQLKAEGVTIVDNIETYDYGKFVHIIDVEGNKIELWEPID